DRDRRMFARRAATEQVAGQDNVARLHFLHELRIQVFQAVLPELLGVRHGQVASWDDHIRVYVVAVFPDASPDFHRSSPVLSATCIESCLLVMPATARA